MKLKIFKIILMLLLIIPLWKSHVVDNNIDATIIEIKKEDIFNQKGDYFVLFFQQSCLSCKNSILYINIVLKNLEYNFFCVEVLSSSINSCDNKSNIGINDFILISVCKVPSLFFIEKGMITCEIVGFNNIRYYLDLLKRE